jgi:glycosyltransferase involved in cell wall biosynthesis/SAM-dependent methyltransferase
MRILAVFPSYPGAPYDGSAVYERHLLAAMRRRGADVDVLATRAVRPRTRDMFSLEWPAEEPHRGEHERIPVRRYRSLPSRWIGARATESIVRRFSREDVRYGEVLPGSAAFVRHHVGAARARPRRFDLLAAAGRGPLVPGLVARMLLTAQRYDAVICGYLPFALPAQAHAAARLRGTPLLLLPFLHAEDRTHHFRMLLETCRRADAVLTLSRDTATLLEQHVPGVRAVTLGAGSAVPAPGEAVDGERFRRERGLEGRALLLFVGRKEPSKRYAMAIEALDHLPASATLLMAGKDVDGTPVRHPRVRLLGVLEDRELAAAYAACDVLVHPSEHESFGMVVLDAWARGKPVVGNGACAVTAELVDDGVDGFLCRDARELGLRVGELLADPGRAAQMGDAGRQKAQRDYTWDRVGERAMSCVADVLARRGNGPPPASPAVEPPASRPRAAPPRRAPRPAQPPGRWDPILYPEWEGVVPERRLWVGPQDSVAHFLRWPFEYRAYLTLLCDLKRTDSVLELGCNHGRTMLGLLDYLQPPGRYEGLDILEPQIAHARAEITRRSPAFRFTAADVHNDAYNPTGTQDASSYRFPYEDRSFDCAYAASLFTHLLPGATANYLRETRRVLKPGARCLYSFFILDFYRGPGTSAHPLYEFDARLEGAGGVAVHDVEVPAAVVAYERAALESAAREAGLAVRRILPGFWSAHGDYAVNEQDLVLLEAV